MSSVRAYSSSDLFPSSKDTEHPDDSSLQGVPATVKLLLKLIEDEKEASSEEDGNKRMLRVTSIMTILDNVRTRIQNCQSLGNKKEAELRRCKTDLQKPINVPRDKRVYIEPADDKEKLRRELNACLASRKNLEAMCSSLGKEKEIMAAELARKVHELNEVEELVNDLKVQNETLMKKIQECARDHRERRKHSVGGEAIVNAALQERNKALSEQLLKSLEGYKSMKRRLKEAQEENASMHAKMEEMGEEIKARLERIRSIKQRMEIGSEESVNIKEEIAELEHMFECFEMKISTEVVKKVECVKPKGEINACCKPSVLA